MDNNLKYIVEKLNNKTNVFLTGGAGVGKTTLLGKVIKDYEERGKKVAKLASTGMASTLLSGQTLHSFFDFGICKDEDDLKLKGKYELKRNIKKLIKSMSLIVIDEISMVSSELFNMIFLRLTQAEFDGSLLVVGDFLQLPPIVKGFDSVRFAFESDSWKEFSFEKIELKNIYRTDNEDFIQILHNVRFANIDEYVHNKLNTYIKPLPVDLSEFTFLFGKNNSASVHNKEQLQNIDGDLFIKEAQTVKHISSVKDYEIDRFYDEARIEKELNLKVGAPVLFTRNSWNYFNGERAKVVNIDDNFVWVEKNSGVVIKLEMQKQSKTKWKEKKVGSKKEFEEEELFSIYQFPIKLAFAITIHKSQGMSIDNLIIQTNEIFAPSQFYVAISRSSNPQNLILIAPKRQWYELIYVDKKAIDFVKINENKVQSH